MRERNLPVPGVILVVSEVKERIVEADAAKTSAFVSMSATGVAQCSASIRLEGQPRALDATSWDPRTVGIVKGSGPVR